MILSKNLTRLGGAFALAAIGLSAAIAFYASLNPPSKDSPRPEPTPTTYRLDVAPYANSELQLPEFSRASDISRIL